jgi:hypothetical protein
MGFFSSGYIHYPIWFIGGISFFLVFILCGEVVPIDLKNPIMYVDENFFLDMPGLWPYQGY